MDTPGHSGPVRDLVRYYAGTNNGGDNFYSAVNQGSTAYGLFKQIPKAGSFKLFHWDRRIDLQRAFKSMSKIQISNEVIGASRDVYELRE